MIIGGFACREAVETGPDRTGIRPRKSRYTNPFSLHKHELRWLKDLWKHKGIRLPMPELNDPAATMPQQEPHRSSEAIWSVLPELIKLDRNEKRGDRAIRDITQSKRYFIKRS
jgi:hypothetical protein